MPTRLEPCVSIDFDSCTLEDIVSKAKDWALMHGNYFKYDHLITMMLNTNLYILNRSLYEISTKLQS